MNLRRSQLDQPEPTPLEAADRTNQLTNRLLFVGAMAFTLILLVGIATLYVATGGASTTNRIAEASDLVSCRALAYGDVLEANSTLAVATANLHTAETDLIVVSSEGQAAFATGDAEGISTAIVKGEAARNAIIAARTNLTQAAAGQSAAQDAYTAKVNLALSDPATFIEECNAQ